MTFSDVIDLPGAQRAATGVSSPRRDRAMSRPMFARHLETLADEELNRRMTHTCGPLPQGEVEAMAVRLADLKTRYYATVLEVGKQRGLPQPEQFRELQALRQYCEELEAGYFALIRDIESGAVRVQGVTDPVY